ncbi:hypothetical protein [Cetobacterium sp.]|uniref:hypothetical protein n=1 Tax=Cetobacterium sp. TaxID=2071632 RepID=UPI003EE62311
MIYRAQELSSNDTEKDKEINNIKKILQNNNYPDGFIKNVIKTFMNKNGKSQKENVITTIKIPYLQNTAESIRAFLAKYNIRTVFQINNTLKKMLTHLKDPIKKDDQTNCVYKVKCQDCNATYVGETSRQLKTRLKNIKDISDTHRKFKYS